MSFRRLDVTTFAQRLAAEGSDALQLVDVREPSELALAALPNFLNFPLSQAGQWADKVPVQLDLHAETIVMCHHGMRSAQMCQWLVEQGFTAVSNLEGGIDAYACQIDPTVPRY